MLSIDLDKNVISHIPYICFIHFELYLYKLLFA